MHEAAVAQRDAHVQLLALQAHEHQVTAPDIAARDRRPRAELFRRGARHVESGLVGSVLHQSAAIEATWRRAAKAIRLADQRGGIRHESRRGAARSG